MACLGAGNAVRPATIVLNKATIASELHGRITWGAAQLGIAAGVMDCVADGVFSEDDAAELVLLVAVWVDPSAADETAVRAANREAVRRAVEDALSTDRSGRIRELLDLRDGATNAFYSGR
jgi:5,6,7,8-tetrahydromethanopterin hydro-lyase